MPKVLDMVVVVVVVDGDLILINKQRIDDLGGKHVIYNISPPLWVMMPLIKDHVLCFCKYSQSSKQL